MELLFRKIRVQPTKRQKEGFYAIAILLILSVYTGTMISIMGASNFFSTIMNTSYRLLIDTALYILAISVVMGALGNVLAEFGIVKLLNRLFAPLMKPLYNLPGAASLGIVTTYLSDNPSILVLANDRKYLKFFNKEHIPCLCNLGTSFGMGLIITTYMIGQGFVIEPIIGNIGAIVGSIVSVRLMNHTLHKRKYFETYQAPICPVPEESVPSSSDDPDEGFFSKVMTSMLEGGKNGVEMGMKIIPGLLIICTIVMTLTFGTADASAGYQGAAYEGIGLIPRLGDFFSPILRPLFGFTSSEAIAFPITSLGAVGAAISLVPKMLNLGFINGNDIAVFTAMGMCWSGYLSTHVSMMDALNHRKLISASIISHTFGGLIAGISAHYIYLLVQWLF